MCCYPVYSSDAIIQHVDLEVSEYVFLFAFMSILHVDICFNLSSVLHLYRKKINFVKYKQLSLVLLKKL